MKLAKIKTRYLTNFVDTGWLELKQDITLFVADDSDQIPSFFKLLEAVNPFSSASAHLYDYPEFIEKGGYSKRVQPAKTTTAYTIFEGDNELVKRLGELDPSLYELDQIEVGRRLDNSRWLSFVEISQSSKWGDIKEGVDRLLETVDASCQRHCEPPSLKASDRLRGEVGKTISTYLTALLQCVAEPDRKVLKEIIFTANKDQRFQEAIESTYSYLPQLCYVEADEIERVIHGSSFSTPVVFLVDASSITNPQASLSIYNSLKNLGEATQVLYAVKDRDTFPLDDSELGYWYSFETDDQGITQLTKKT